ncbi:MAG: acyl-CoA desaturase, partial [Nevskiales bacterium]
YGFWDSHLGWVFRDARQQADLSLLPEFTRYPELMWLNKYHFVPGLILAAIAYAIAGLPGLFVGFILSTVLVYHVTFLVNSLAHVVGRQRYLTGDDSRNCWWIALLTFGEGWHNNHHHYQSAARQGFRWYELDISYLTLRLLEKLGFVWDLHAPPEQVVSGERRPSKIVIEKTAGHLAASFPVEQIVEQVKQAWANSHHMDDLKRLAREKVDEAEARLADIELPSLPSLEDIRKQASKTFAKVPALDSAVERAREKLHNSVVMQLLDDLKLQTAKV